MIALKGKLPIRHFCGLFCSQKCRVRFCTGRVLTRLLGPFDLMALGQVLRSRGGSMFESPQPDEIKEGDDAKDELLAKSE